MAYGALNLRPREFEDLTVSEFLDLLQGYKWRKERKEEFTAYFVSCLMNTEGKALKINITVKDLVAPFRNKKVIRTKKEDKKYLIEKFNLKEVQDGNYCRPLS